MLPVVTGTGFHGVGRSQVRDAAIAAGAMYSGDLQKGITTHLVVSDTAGLYVYSGAEVSHQQDAKRPRAPLQDAAAGDGHNMAQPPMAVEHGSPPAALQRSTAAGDAVPAGSTAAVVLECAGQQNAQAEQENRVPQPGPSSAAASPCSREHTAECTEALAAELEGMQVRSSPLSRSALVSLQNYSSSMLGTNLSVAAAASRASSCTGSVASDEDGIECSQRPPASDDAGAPLTLPSPAERRQSNAGSQQVDMTTAASPQPTVGAAAAASPERTATTYTEPPSTVTSSSQQWVTDWNSAGLRRTHGAARRLVLCGVQTHCRWLVEQPLGTRPGTVAPSSHSSRQHGFCQQRSSGIRKAHQLQVLARPPRGNTVCEYHNLNRKQLARVQFAELIQVVGAGMVLSTKDRKVAALVQPSPLAVDADGSDGPAGMTSSIPLPVLADIRSLYCMPDGEYWCEYCRFFTAEDIGRLARECGQPIPLPTDFDRRHELLKGIERLHCRLADIGEQRRVRHSKQVGPMRRNDGGGLFWRSCFDTELRRCVTDVSVKQFIA